jgi:hypothetical protein
MTNDFEFIKYEPTPGEKHLGLATVKAFGKILLRFKVIPAKNGGFFSAPLSCKLPDGTYTPSFILDSRCDEEELFTIIRKNVKPFQKQMPIVNEEIPF